MDSVLGIGTPELIVIVMIAVIFLGPERIRPAAHWLGQTTAQAKALTRGLMTQLNRELDAVDSTGDVKATLQEMNELRRQITDMRQEMLQGVRQPFQEGQQALQETRSRLDNSLKAEARLASVPPKPAAVQESTAPDRPATPVTPPPVE